MSTLSGLGGAGGCGGASGSPESLRMVIPPRSVDDVRVLGKGGDLRAVAQVEFLIEPAHVVSNRFLTKLQVRRDL